MQFPHMLIMRNSPEGTIWQAYTVQNDREVELLTKTATHNGFLVFKEAVGYADESHPGWRESQEWKDYLAGRLSDRAQGQMASREILKSIRRDGPYWLGGYNDWLVSCFSLRNPSWIKRMGGIENQMDHCQHLDKTKPPGAERWKLGKDHGRWETQIDVTWDVTHKTKTEVEKFINELRESVKDDLWPNYGMSVL